MALVYIGIGSNLGDKKSYMDSALNLLSERGDIEVKAVSGFIETEPVGGPPQGKFLNGVICISTAISPFELIDVLREIENSLGRKRDKRWGPRTIDLDILLYDDLIIDTDGLIIPHPRMLERDFVLRPLLEIAPDIIHPVIKRPIRTFVKEPFAK